MTYLDTWRTNLKTHLAEFAPLAKEDRSINLIYGITAAAVLWGVRDAPFNDEHTSALKEACGDEKHLPHLLKALGGWDDTTQLEAVRKLNKRQRESDELREALTALMSTFIEELFEQNMLQQKIDISGSVIGGNVNIGGYQIVAGDLIIQYIVPKAERLCPKPSEEPAHFGGRDDELESLILTLKSGQNCAITALNGVGGMGKTTLARVIASRLYKDKTFRAVLWADVTRNPNFITLIKGWAHYADSAFEIQDKSEEQIALQVKALLDELINEQCEDCEPSRVLVVLDDLWDNGKAIARRLIQAKPEDATVLITARSENLAIDLEVTSLKPLTRMANNQAAALLASYLPQAETASLERLGEALGGHPLAMELAARRIKKEAGRDNLATTLERCIKDYQQGIPAGTTFANLKLEQGEEKDDNLTTSLYHSYEALGTQAKNRFRALGVLAYDEPFDINLLRALWISDSDEITGDYCDELRLLSLIESLPDQPGWYRQHPLLRSYARALLNDHKETVLIFNNYVDHITTIAQGFDTLPLEQWQQLDPYLPHIDYLGDELTRLWQTESQPETALSQRMGDFAYAVTNYVGYRPQMIQTERGPERRGLRWLEIGLEIYKNRDDPKRSASFCNNIGAVWSALGEQQKALDYYEQALALYRAVGDRGGEAVTLNNIGSVWSALGEQQKALDHYEQALPLRRAVGDRGGEANTLTNIGSVWSALGEKQKALDYYEQALPLRRVVGDRDGEATILHNIGAVWSTLGEKQKALDYYEQALPLSRAVGNRGGEAATLNNIGLVWSALGEQQKALDSYEQALPLSRAVGDRGGEAATLTNIGAVWSALGEQQKALASYEQALPLRRAVGDRGGEATTLSNIGAVWSALGEQQKALDYYEQALPLFRAVGDRGGKASTLNNMSFIYFQNGELGRTLAIQEQIITIMQHIGAVAQEALYHLNISYVLQGMGRIEEAIKHVEQGRAILVKYNLPQDAGGNTLADYDAFLAQLRGGASQPSQERLSTLSDDTVQTLAGNTAAVMTQFPEKRNEWHEVLQKFHADWTIKGDDWVNEVAFVGALLTILDGKEPSLPDNNPYADIISQINTFIKNDHNGENQ